MTDEPTPDPRIEADARSVSAVAPDLWSRIEAELDAPSAREALVSRSTAQRRLLGALGVLVIGTGVVAAQGVRADLEPAGWALFAACGGSFVLGSLAAAAWSLRSHGEAPLPGWPWVPLTWVAMMAGTALPWPGMVGVPPEAHAYCFGMSSVMVVLSTIWLALLERSARPVPWRVGLAAAGSGLAAFAFQSVFCPGVDLAHLVLGHGGAGIVWAALAVGGALILRRV
ncbi:MAG: hypothetical protein R3F61_38260 [Myxococcota bacterium]